MDTISHELADKGPWEAGFACQACQGHLSENAYYANSSVCKHCGARESLDLIVRRKVFREPIGKPKLSLWHRVGAWCGVTELLDVARPFEWEVKETDG